MILVCMNSIANVTLAMAFDVKISSVQTAQVSCDVELHSREAPNEQSRWTWYSSASSLLTEPGALSADDETQM